MTRHQKRARRTNQFKTALTDLVDAIWNEGLGNRPGLQPALKYGQRQLDISEGFVKNDA